MLLSRIGSRIVRPAVSKAARASPPRSRGINTRTAAQKQPNQQQSQLARQQRQPNVGAVARPFGFANDLFFPGQVGSVFRDIESELARLWNQEGQAVARTALGAVDIKETKDAYTFKLDAPGLTSKDVKVRVAPGNVLVISGERVKEEDKEDDMGFHRVERVYGQFERRFQLPDNVDTSKIEAKVENGELRVSVPKMEVNEPQDQEVKVS